MMSPTASVSGTESRSAPRHGAGSACPPPSFGAAATGSSDGQHEGFPNLATKTWPSFSPVPTHLPKGMKGQMAEGGARPRPALQVPALGLSLSFLRPGVLNLVRGAHFPAGEAAPTPTRVALAPSLSVLSGISAAERALSNV